VFFYFRTANINYNSFCYVAVVADGRRIVNPTEQQWNWTDIFLVAGANWIFGGEWKPADCVASYHMAVIIPFRDRDFNLKALLHHLIPLLQKQFIHFRIFVVEQVTTVF